MVMKKKRIHGIEFISFISGRIRFSNYAKNKYRQIQCHLKPIIRPEGEEYWATLTDGFSFDQNQTPVIYHDYFAISCRSETEDTYSNVHLAIRVDGTLKNRYKLQTNL